MTDKTQPDPSTGTALQTRPIAPELDELARVGQWLAAAEARDPDTNQKGAAAALRMYLARELGLPPLAGLELSVVKGRVVVSARLYQALAYRAGYKVVELADQEPGTSTAVLIERATGEEIGRRTFTMAMAKQGGLIRAGGSWETYPERMLWARASANVVKDYAPGVALGLMLDDEAAEVLGEPAPEPPDDPHEFVEEAEFEDVTAEELGELAHEGEQPDEPTEAAA